mgnify:CR=1 FL=1
MFGFKELITLRTVQDALDSGHSWPDTYPNMSGQQNQYDWFWIGLVNVHGMNDTQMAVSASV